MSFNKKRTSRKTSEKRELNPNVKANYQVFKKNGRTFMSFIDVVNDAELKPQARILFQIIASLSVYEGYCYASNAYLGDRLGLKDKMVTAYLNQLQEANLIKTENVVTKYGRGRHITILFHEMRKRYLKKEKEIKRMY